ncbi:MAG TPA: hypothetical protein PLA25_11040 [Anaerolineaceae bacterium]|jgi:hypothetical protein|nr:hypothetical protein [Longilinea sp.]HQF63343.1 hypothetical protein [Anaerolineaceae bacterium]HQH86360.1 hypothetical protein [Anaerolineaceae bacterium]HQN44661.1 hypothetical protein [Anaerolineaceae bacterium]
MTDDRILNFLLLIAGFCAAITPANPRKLLIVTALTILVIELIINGAGSTIRDFRQFHQFNRMPQNAMKLVRVITITTRATRAAFEFIILSAFLVTLTESKIPIAFLEIGIACFILGIASLVYAIVCENLLTRLSEAH